MKTARSGREVDDVLAAPARPPLRDEFLVKGIREIRAVVLDLVECDDEPEVVVARDIPAPDVDGRAARVGPDGRDARDQTVAVGAHRGEIGLVREFDEDHVLQARGVLPRLGQRPAPVEGCLRRGASRDDARCERAEDRRAREDSGVAGRGVRTKVR